MGDMNAGHLRNLEDMLSTYNRLTELCFTKCISNMNTEKLSGIESDCVNSCSSKSVNGSHRIMSTFMEIQGRKQEAARAEGERNARDAAAAAQMAQQSQQVQEAIPEQTLSQEIPTVQQ